MDFYRRKFVQKLSFALGAVSIPGLSLGMNSVNSIKKPSSILHVGEISLFKKNKFDFKWDKTLKSGFTVVTNSGNLGFSNINSSDLFDAVLFTAQSNINHDIFSETMVPWVNSNLEGNPVYVKEYLITERLGKKVGILGIDFKNSSETVPQLIQLIKSKAGYLKGNMGCDQIYCLIDDPKGIDPNTSLVDLVQESEEVDIFFASSTSSVATNLWALPNLSGRQVLLSVQSGKGENYSQLDLKNCEINTYKQE